MVLRYEIILFHFSIIPSEIFSGISHCEYNSKLGSSRDELTAEQFDKAEMKNVLSQFYE